MNFATKVIKRMQRMITFRNFLQTEILRILPNALKIKLIDKSLTSPLNYCQSQNTLIFATIGSI